MLKRLTILLALMVLCVGNTAALAKDGWVSVRSKNFFVLGNGNEDQVTQVASRLEQFRDVISRMFPGVKISSPAPTTVIVFKSETSYRPFKLNDSNAGYFQPGQDVNYITLTTEVQGDQDPFTVIFHEYTHLLVNNTIENAPTWFNEGLAEYYSTFSITNDQQVILGRPIASHVELLRQKRMLPLRTLFEVDTKSPYYNESDKQSIFYAESWALMHYLILNRNPQRISHVTKFLELLSARVPVETAFPAAFQTTFEEMESELRRYVSQDRYPIVRGHFERKLESKSELTVRPVSEAEAQAYLGDLMVHSNRIEAESYLQNALRLDPNLALAHAALGMLRFRQNRLQEARLSLERAVAANYENYLIHYYYALILARPNQEDIQLSSGFSLETAQKIRTELKKAIALRPDFPESYNLLAFINLVTNTDIDESILMLRQALGTSPGRVDFTYMLGQLYMNKDDYKSARPLLEQVASSDAEERVRNHSKRLIDTITKIEEQRARLARAKRDGLSGRIGAQPLRGKDPEDLPPTDDFTPPTLEDVLRVPEPDERQLQGTLLHVECHSNGLVFVVKTSSGFLRLKSDDFTQVQLMTFDTRIRGKLTCGSVKPENSVVVCYVPERDRKTSTDGVLRSIQFVPADFHLAPAA